jgi:hypothetical protein
MFSVLRLNIIFVALNSRYERMASINPLAVADLLIRNGRRQTGFSYKRGNHSFEIHTLSSKSTSQSSFSLQAGPLTKNKMEVIPVMATDQQKPIHNIRTRTFFIFDVRLDESTLQSGLDNLIRNHWRKLGARLFTRPGDKNGLLEYRLPKTFDSGYHLFEWSSTEFNHSISNSAPLRFFHDPPAVEKGVTLLHSLKDVDTVVRPPTWPQKSEWIYTYTLTHTKY